MRDERGVWLKEVWVLWDDDVLFEEIMMNPVKEGKRAGRQRKGIGFVFVVRGRPRREKL